LKLGTTLRCVIGACLIGAAVWSLYLAAFNWWAAGGPPTQYPEIYARRGNTFFALGCSFFLAGLALLLLEARRFLRARHVAPGG
jgi:glycerol uptake facilitator-like aquaporin